MALKRLFTTVYSYQGSKETIYDCVQLQMALKRRYTTYHSYKWR